MMSGCGDLVGKVLLSEVDSRCTPVLALLDDEVLGLEALLFVLG